MDISPKINVDKVRLWNVRFSREVSLEYMPYPCMIVEEIEDRNYRMPLFNPMFIPIEIGGQLTITLKGKGILKVGNHLLDLLPYRGFPLGLCRTLCFTS